MIKNLRKNEELLRSYVNNDKGLLLFCNTAEIKKSSHKKMIITAGEKADHIYLLLKGSVKIFYKRSDGKEIIISILSGLNFFGEMGYLEQEQLRNANVISKSEILYAEMPYNKFETCIQLYPSLLKTLTIQISKRLMVTSIKLSSTYFNDVHTRVYETLKSLANLPEATLHPLGKQIFITRQEIGLMVGCSRETVGRVFKDLEQKNKLTAHGKKILLFKDSRDK